MKKLKSLFIAGATLLTANSFAQPVHDVAVIPVAVTINTTMRLNVVSGGNVEFVVNTIEQYQNGITNPNVGGAVDRIHDTRFTVASSRDFDVLMFAEDACLVGTDVSSSTGGTLNTLNLNNIGYRLHMEPSANHVHNTEIDLISNFDESIVSLSNSTATQIVSNVASSAGGTNDNDFVINWELATATLITLTSQGTLLEQSIPQDRYITNVYLVLVPA